MDIELLLSFLLASITLSLMPGPDNVIAQTSKKNYPTRSS